MSNRHTHQYIVGIDEAGRGPIAGPVTVGAIAFLKPFDHTRLDGVKDSKKLSAKKRDYFRSIIDELQAEGVMRACAHSTPSTVIDTKGIMFAIRSSLSKVLETLALPPQECEVLLDGSLKAPEEYTNQETIIKGDETELPITLAGIFAKTTRDAEMLVFAEQYPEYSFDTHKGYGTKAHYQAIKERGLCALHRSSFIK